MEAEVFLGEGRFDICPAGGTLCTGKQELHVCFALILSGVYDGTWRKRLAFPASVDLLCRGHSKVPSPFSVSFKSVFFITFC